MKKWIICYEDKQGDVSKVWTIADTKQEAIDDVKHEYWDINEIVYCHEM